MPSLQILPLLLVTNNILSSIDGELILSSLKYINDVILSLLEVILGFLVLIFVFRLFILLSTKSEEIIILPFEVSTSKKTYNGNIISNFLLLELRKIKEIHDHQFEEESIEKLSPNTENLSQPSQPTLICETIYLPKLSPNTEQFETTVSNLGNINIAGMTLSVGSILTVLKRLWPLGGQARTVKGSLQEYDSEIHLIAFMEGPKTHGWDISRKIEQSMNEDKIPELIKDLAFIITYDLSKGETKKKEGITAKTWIGLKYFTESLDYYSQYKITKKLEYLENAWEDCIKALQEENDYQILSHLFYHLGISYLNIKDYKVAENAFRHCITLKLKNENIFIGLALALDQIGRHEEALEAYGEALGAYEETLEINPEDAEVWSNKGVTLVRLDRYGEALEAYGKALEIKPEFVDAWFNKGVTLFRLDRYEEALEAYEKILKIDSQYADAWYNKGNILGKSSQYKEALDAYKKSLEINPENENAWFGKGVTFGTLGKYEEALKAFEKALEINHVYVEAWFNKGVTLAHLGRNDEALKAFEIALEIYPEFADAWSGKGSVLIGLGRYGEALEACEKALEINPDYANAWSNKGVTLVRLDRYEEALEAYGKALEINPEYLKVWYKRACVYSLMNLKNEALADLKRAVELDSSYKEEAKKDKDFEKLWEDEDFKEIVRADEED